MSLAGKISTIADLILQGARHRSASLVFALLVVWPVGSSVQSRELVYGQGLLWKVEAPNDSVEPSYVLGTIHVSDPRILNLPKAVREAFALAKSATFEIRQSSSDQARALKLMSLDGGKTLGDYLNREQLKLVGKAAELYGLPEHVLQRFKPWALYLMFSVPPSEQQRKAKGKKALDFALQTRARDFGVPVYGLETLDEQLALFDSLQDEVQVAYLDSVLRQLDQFEMQFERLLQLYLARDISAIQSLAMESLDEADREAWESFQTDVIDRRNFLMVERMQERLHEGAAFVAVGALHLPGEKGVLKLLQGQGYRLTRLY
ncbi:TraB/GumN family protein [Pelagibius sp. Alg239-R121]|uniref:TraB/GumN family protein n=1 Tax=Pelagibius sp. Alg239-R121 TaxID=2993448 RepID=UPI0024A785D8|nr:TraB/GumN family protein [Pelagibius sp. Alg239-R121]